MIRFLGIDYGTKRVGVAVSDEAGKLAFPLRVLPNDAKIFEKLQEVVLKDNISEIVIGEADLILNEVEVFEKELVQRFKMAVHRQKEELTTLEARRYQTGLADARAAALILQRYLDRRNTSA